MQRSSPSIAALAAALAKAQIELANPEKSLTGTIEAQDGQGSARQFRYAPLSSGLEIVRKTLGQHEIATVQTTAVDQASGIVNLTTILAHSSGEWIASDWPVCPIAETATPHRIGAALTYARRYALFTLVGIAGEDDLDAPDLAVPEFPITTKPKLEKSGNGNGSQYMTQEAAAAGRRRATRVHSAQPELSAAASADLRDVLLAEIEHLSSADNAALWAQRRLIAKNQLVAADAQRAEAAFVAKLTAVATPGADAEETTLLVDQNLVDKAEPLQINKSVLAFPEPRRIRDRDYIRYIVKQPCLICGRRPSDAHHLRFAQLRALGRKVSDEFTVPLCRAHHREVHRHGDEAAWWQKAGIDPIQAARVLWLETHPLPSVKPVAVNDAARKGIQFGKTLNDPAN
jgi:hypothetical protein